MVHILHYIIFFKNIYCTFSKSLCRPAIAWATWDLIAMVENGRHDGPPTHAVTFVWNGQEVKLWNQSVYLCQSSCYSIYDEKHVNFLSGTGGGCKFGWRFYW